MSHELLPCPFCNGPAETDDNRTYRAIVDGRVGRAVAVYCHECHADMTFCCRDVPDADPDALLADLVKAWNRRASGADFDLVAHLERQRSFSLKTFGPGTRAAGVVDHIRKELREIEADPTDVEEWIDVIILAFDGAWRAGYEPPRIVEAILAKQAKNEARRWPDWRHADPDKAIEHDRSADHV